MTRVHFKVKYLIDWTVIAILCRSAIRYCVYSVLAKLGLSFLTIFVCTVIVYGPLLLALIFSSRKQGQILSYKIFLFFCFYLLIASFFAITLLIHPDYSEYYFTDSYLNIMYSIFRPDTGALWGFLVFCLYENPPVFFKNIRIASIINLIYYAFEAYVSGGVWEGYSDAGLKITKSYSLNFGYDVAFCLIIFLFFFFEEKRKSNLILIFISLWLIITAGSRGALICPVAFVAMYYINKINNSNILKQLLALLCLGTIGALVCFNSAQIVTWLLNVLSRLNIQSRTIRMILSGNLTTDNGRAQLYSIAWNAIRKQGFWGNGAYGSRPVIVPYYFWGYPHNIALEFMLDYGLCLGIVLLVIIICLCMKVFCLRKHEISMILIIFIAINVKLLISDSYWISSYFWLFIGFLFNVLRKNKHRATVKNLRENELKSAPEFP